MASIATNNDLSDFVLFGDDSSYNGMFSQRSTAFDAMFAQQALSRPQHESFDQLTASSSSTARSSPFLHTEQTVAPSDMFAPNIINSGFDDFNWPTMADDCLFGVSNGRYVDPTLLNASTFETVELPQQTTFIAEHPEQRQNPSQAPSPAPSNRSVPQRPGSAAIKAASNSPYLSTISYQPYDASARRPQTISRHHSQDSTVSRADSDDTRDDQKTGRAALCEKCGKRFQDIKAHKLTHLEERPEKCSIVTCEWHTKGFARKYDCQRHLLTHYKGTMVCGFCPHAGTAAEKSFNRADVFKRHLLQVHNVEQPPPNGRKRGSPSIRSVSAVSTASNKSASTTKEETPAKCSICSKPFDNAQAFYDHLDNCVLFKVGQEEPSERINAQNLASVENDAFVVNLKKEQPLLPLSPPSSSDCESSDESDEEESSGKKQKKRRAAKGTKGVFTWSVEGISQKGRPSAGKKSKRATLPPAWGLPPASLTMKKRTMAVFDGDRRILKDEMMLSTKDEVRMDIDDGQWITDLDAHTLERTQDVSVLDFYTLQRSEAFLDATDAEKGPYSQRDLGWGAGKGAPMDEQASIEADFGF